MTALRILSFVAPFVVLTAASVNFGVALGRKWEGEASGKRVQRLKSLVVQAHSIVDLEPDWPSCAACGFHYKSPVGNAAVKAHARSIADAA